MLGNTLFMYFKCTYFAGVNDTGLFFMISAQQLTSNGQSHHVHDENVEKFFWSYMCLETGSDLKSANDNSPRSSVLVYK